MRPSACINFADEINVDLHYLLVTLTAAVLLKETRQLSTVSILPQAISTTCVLKLLFCFRLFFHVRTVFEINAHSICNDSHSLRNVTR